jgi:hypothetical protein
VGGSVLEEAYQGEHAPGVQAFVAEQIVKGLVQVVYFHAVHLTDIDAGE